MNRVHLQIIFYIILISLIVGLGVLTYQAYAYRKAKEYVVEVAKTASYAAELEYRNIKEDNGDINLVAQEYYKVLNMVVSPDIDININFPILVILSEDGYYSYRPNQAEPIKRNEAYGYKEDGTVATLDYYKNNVKTYASATSEEGRQKYGEFHEILEGVINDSIQDIRDRMSLDIPWMHLDPYMEFSPQPSIIAIYVSPYHIFNRQSYTGVYQVGGQITKKAD